MCRYLLTEGGDQDLGGEKHGMLMAPAPMQMTS